MAKWPAPAGDLRFPERPEKIDDSFVLNRRKKKRIR